MATEDEDIDFNKACEILGISLEEIKIGELTKDYIKKKYHKLALKWHPDKNLDSTSTMKFQKIKYAYEYLSKELNIVYSNDDTDFDINSNTSYNKQDNVNDLYITILRNFISSIINGDLKEIIMSIMQLITKSTFSISSLQDIIKDLDKQTLIEVYIFLCKYKELLYINDSLLEQINTIIEEQYKQDTIIILKPTIKDLWDNNVYKLNVNNEFYLVPLWHSELYFDKKEGGELIVLCYPSLNKGVTIDEHNNIIVEFKINISDELTKIIKNNNLSINIGDKIFKIPLNALYLKEYQTYTIKGRGISRICEKDIYNVNVKSDIIIHILLE